MKDDGTQEEGEARSYESFMKKHLSHYGYYNGCKFHFYYRNSFFQILIVYLLSQKHCYTQRVSRDKGASNLLFTKKRHKLSFFFFEKVAFNMFRIFKP